MVRTIMRPSAGCNLRADAPTSMVASTSPDAGSTRWMAVPNQGLAQTDPNPVATWCTSRSGTLSAALAARAGSPHRRAGEGQECAGVLQQRLRLRVRGQGGAEVVGGGGGLGGGEQPVGLAPHGDDIGGSGAELVGE